jgi:tRNA(Ile)-lysidine synthase
MTSSSAATPTRPPRSSRRSPASAAAPAAEPLGEAETGRLIAALGPFERAPVLAVGVSGGADSLALTLLAEAFARARGGRVVGLTVDHRLRPGSDHEARTVGGWLRARGIEHHVLVWPGPHPASGLQAAAREARLALLGDWCRARGVLHLLLAHHADDQAETIAMRAARRSGEAGLAGMAAVREIRGLRLLRPLLGVPKARLVTTLEAIGHAWLEDPSNRDPRFERGRLRADRSTAGGHLTRHPDLPTSRAARECLLARALVRTVRLHPAGFARIDREAWRALPAALRNAVLARVLTTIRGGRYAPRRARLEPLAAALASAATLGRTLGGCLVRADDREVLVMREPLLVGDRVTLAPGDEALLDRRFRVCSAPGSPPLLVRRLGGPGWRRLRAAGAHEPLLPLPHPVRLGLPALWREGAGRVDPPLQGPHLDFWAKAGDGRRLASVRFSPERALGEAAFATMPLFEPEAQPILGSG